MTQNPISIRRIETDADQKMCFAVRREVFVIEQKIDPEIEFDGLDDECLHYLLVIYKAPMAAARVRILGDEAKIQRVAVRYAARGAGLGLALMRKILDDMREEGMAKAVLSSQTEAIAFYEQLGFVAHGPEYMDAGIPHRDMSLSL